MVELNNKLKLPLYTRFEHKFLANFENNSELKIQSNDFNVSLDDVNEMSLDIDTQQFQNHKNRLNNINVININRNENKPVEINFNGEANFSAHTTINIEKNCENKIVLNVDLNSEISSNSIEVNAHPNSNTELVIIMTGKGKNSNFIKCNVEADATLNVYYINSAQNDLNDVSVALLGENSSSHLKIVAIAKEAKKYFSTRIDHFAKNSFGRLVNHGVALNDSKLLINGFGKIHKQCNKSDNYQKTKVLALDETSCVEANPILLIDEYDVWASHAASVSNVDPASLYYLQSRGLSFEVAQKLLIKGFLKSIVNEIDNDHIKELFQNTLDEKIGISIDA